MWGVVRSGRVKDARKSRRWCVQAHWTRVLGAVPGTTSDSVPRYWVRGRGGAWPSRRREASSPEGKEMREADPSWAGPALSVRPGGGCSARSRRRARPASRGTGPPAARPGTVVPASIAVFGNRAGARAGAGVGLPPSSPPVATFTVSAQPAPTQGRTATVAVLVCVPALAVALTVAV
jgi:hypothetical protein